MKKQLLAAVLALCTVIALLSGTTMAASSVLIVKVGEPVTLRCKEGEGETHERGGGSRDILRISERGGKALISQA